MSLVRGGQDRKEFDKLSEIVSIVVEGASTDEVAVDHAGFVDEGTSANLHDELPPRYLGRVVSRCHSYRASAFMTT